MNALDTPLRSLRELYDETHAEIEAEHQAIMRLYREIDRRGARIAELEARAATLGDEMARRRNDLPNA